MFDATPKLCAADKSIIQYALLALMEDTSERIKRNSHWIDTGKVPAEAERARCTFAADYMSAVRAAGMC
jgi:hypothetical protein